MAKFVIKKLPRPSEMIGTNEYISLEEELSSMYPFSECGGFLKAVIKNPQLIAKFPDVDSSYFGSYCERILIEIVRQAARDGATITQPYVDAKLKGMHTFDSDKWTKSGGQKFLDGAIEGEDESVLDSKNYEYNFQVMAKMKMLRNLKKEGVDISDFYKHPKVSAFDKEGMDVIKVRQENFANSSADSIASYYKNVIVDSSVLGQKEEDGFKAGGESTIERIKNFSNTNSWGRNYASKLYTSVTMGMHTSKFGIMSAASGTGKSRIMIANMCQAFAPYLYNTQEKRWEENPLGTNGCALYIGTEMDLAKEVEPVMLAYISGVPQDKIVSGTMSEEEEAVVFQAARYLGGKTKYTSNGEIITDMSETGIFLENMPNFDCGDIEAKIKYYVDKFNITAVFFDYIYASVELKAEYSRSTPGYSARDDLALLNLATRLKEMANKYDIIIESATQVNGDYRTNNFNGNMENETAIRGAKSIADKCDTACILSIVSQADKEKILKYLPTPADEAATKFKVVDGQRVPIDNETGCEKFQLWGDYNKEASYSNDGGRYRLIKMSLYKNRSGKHTNVKIFCEVDYATMRFHDLFVTGSDYVLDKFIEPVLIRAN